MGNNGFPSKCWNHLIGKNFALKQKIIDILIKISRSNLMNQVHNIDFAEQ